MKKYIFVYIICFFGFGMVYGSLHSSLDNARRYQQYMSEDRENFINDIFFEGLEEYCSLMLGHPVKIINSRSPHNKTYYVSTNVEPYPLTIYVDEVPFIEVKVSEEFVHPFVGSEYLCTHFNYIGVNNKYLQEPLKVKQMYRILQLLHVAFLRPKLSLDRLFTAAEIKISVSVDAERKTRVELYEHNGKVLSKDTIRKRCNIMLMGFMVTYWIQGVYKDHLDEITQTMMNKEPVLFEELPEVVEEIQKTRPNVFYCIEPRVEMCVYDFRSFMLKKHDMALKNSDDNLFNAKIKMERFYVFFGGFLLICAFFHITVWQLKKPVSQLGPDSLSIFPVESTPVSIVQDPLEREVDELKESLIELGTDRCLAAQVVQKPFVVLSSKDIADSQRIYDEELLHLSKENKIREYEQRLKRAKQAFMNLKAQLEDVNETPLIQDELENQYREIVALFEDKRIRLTKIEKAIDRLQKRLDDVQ